MLLSFICRAEEGFGVVLQKITVNSSMPFWILRIGAPWQDIPPSYGDWGKHAQSILPVRDKGAWEALLEEFVKEPGFAVALCQSY